MNQNYDFLASVGFSGKASRFRHYLLIIMRMRVAIRSYIRINVCELSLQSINNTKGEN